MSPACFPDSQQNFVRKLQSAATRCPGTATRCPGFALCSDFPWRGVHVRLCWARCPVLPVQCDTGVAVALNQTSAGWVQQDEHRCRNAVGFLSGGVCRVCWL